MNAFLIGVSIGLTLVGLAGFAFGAVFLIYFLAKNNVFFTIVEEGSAKAIMRGGEFRKFVLSYKDYEFDEKWNLGPIKEKVLELKKRGLLWRILSRIGLFFRRILRIGQFQKFFGGIHWIGIPFLNTIYKYNFRWTVLRESEPAEKEEGLVGKPQKLEKSGKWLVSFAKHLDYIYLKDAVYYSGLMGIETSELMPVDLSMLLPIRVINPYTALFQIQNWLTAVLDLIKPSVRQAVSQMTYAEVIGKIEVAEHELDLFLMLSPTQKAKLRELVPERKEGPLSISVYIERTYGVRVKRVAIEDVEPPAVYSEAATLRVAAEQDAKKAEAEAKRIQTLADAEAGRLQTVYGKIKELGETGLAIRMFEAISQGSDKQGNWVIPFGSVRSLLEGVLGHKTTKGE